MIGQVDASRGRTRIGTTEYLVAALVAVVVLRPVASRLFDRPALGNWATIFQAVFLQAVPFLVLGTALSGAVSAFVPASAFRRLERLRPGAAVPVAAACGVLLPGCECASVPLAGRLIDRGVSEAAALTFLLASPAVNPVVLVATSVAFPGRPGFVVARLVASLLAACLTGWIWMRRGRGDLVRVRGPVDSERRGWSEFAGAALHDFTHAGGYLVIGAAAAATLQTVIPKSLLDGLAGNVVLATASLSVLAVLLAVCSEADAFVASGLVQFPIVARLAFLVVGPMVDVKLIALQRGAFGGRFAARFAPLTFCCAVLSAAVVGSVLR